MSKKTLKERLKNWWKENKGMVLSTLSTSLITGGTAYAASRLAYKFGHHDGIWEGIGTASAFGNTPHNLHKLGINNDTASVLQQQIVQEEMAAHNLTSNDIKQASIVINAELEEPVIYDLTKAGKIIKLK